MRDEMIPEDDQGVAQEIWNEQRILGQECVDRQGSAGQLRVYSSAMNEHVKSELQKWTENGWEKVGDLDLDLDFAIPKFDYKFPRERMKSLIPKDFTVTAHITHINITHPSVARIGRMLYVRVADYDIPIDLQKELKLTDAETAEMLARLDEKDREE
jgi:hypothetical protein